MKKLITTILILFAIVPIAKAASTLAEWYYERGESLPSVMERVPLAEEAGIQNYQGTYDQNIKLLNYLQGQQNQQFGATFRPSGIDVNIRQDLVAGASRSDTTLDVDPFITQDGHRITMSDIGQIGFGKIDPGNSNEEIISWTGIIDNTTYYTLTGVQWGYDFYRNATSTANYKRHNAGARFIITNDDHWLTYNFVNVYDPQDIEGRKTFNVLPESTLTATTTYQFVNKAYVDALVNQGAATSTETVAGIAELATQIEMASSTDLGANNPLVLQAKYATSTPDVRGLYVIVSDNDGYLNQSWLDLSEDFTWSGEHTFNSTSTNNVILLSATSTDPSSVQSKAYIDSIKYIVVGTTASDNLVASADTERSKTDNNIFTKVKEIRINLPGDIRVKFDMRINDNFGGNAAGYGKIYVNGVEKMPFATTSTTYVTYSVDLSDLAAGDLVQLYYATESGYSPITVYVRNFRIYYDKTDMTETVVNID